jgi:Tol biopolymer transport system component
VGPAWSPDGTRICYAAQRDLWITPATGGNTRRLTTAGAYDRDPVWSPDGRFVYFWSIREGTTALWRIPAGGGSAVRVTLGSGPEIHPTLSRDGSRLAYSTFSENPNLVVHDLSTGQERQIGEELYEGEPVLSPDELAVAFVSDRQTPGSLNLWLQPLTSAGEPAGPPRRLTTQEGTVSQPSFSPDGRWVAYHRVLNGQRDIWIVPVAGGTPVQFTVDPAVDTQPDWSPDGRTLAFVSDRSGTQHIWVGPVIDGQPAGPAREVTRGSLSQDAPAWSPDGSHLAYVEVDDQGTREVWTVAAEGGTARQVTVGAVAWRVVWDRQTPSLFVSGFWNRDRLSLRRVALDRVGGAEPSVLAWFDKDEARSDFDVSRDGRLLVFSRAEQRGDVWVLDARRGRY